MRPVPAPPLAEFARAALSYGGGVVAVDADLRIEAGAFVGLVGPSGSGKTTLLRALLGQVGVLRGEVRTGAASIGYVPQLETVDWTFPITVAETVLLGRVGESGPFPWARRRDRDDMHLLLAQLGIGDLARRQIRELSGGQQQRVFLARALIRRPSLLLLDEPTSGVDVRTRQDVLGLLRSLNDDGITIVMTTHDLNAVAAMLPELVCLNRRVVAQGPPEVVFTPEILRATFGSDMVVFTHDGMLLTADAPTHDLRRSSGPDATLALGPDHVHHGHIHHGPPHVESSGDAARAAR